MYDGRYGTGASPSSAVVQACGTASKLPFIDVEWSSTRLIIWHSPLDTLPTTVCATASSSAALVASATASCVLWRRILDVSKTDIVVASLGLRGAARSRGAHND